MRPRTEIRLVLSPISRISRCSLALERRSVLDDAVGFVVLL